MPASGRQNTVYFLPTQLDEKVATLHVPALGRELIVVPVLPFVVVVEDATLPVVADTVEEPSSTSVCYGSHCGNHTLVSAPRSSHRGLNVVIYLALDRLAQMEPYGKFACG